MAVIVAVLLPPAAPAALREEVARAGGVSVLDCALGALDGPSAASWTRMAPGQEATGEGPVVVPVGTPPIPGRPTWLHTPTPGPVPEGYAGLVLKGREAGGRYGAAPGLELLAACPEPGRVILDAGLDPDGAAEAVRRGAAGVWVGEAHLGLPAIGLPAHVARRLDLPDDEMTTAIRGVRVAHGPTAAAVRPLLDDAEPLALAAGAWEGRADALWPLGEGLAHARRLAARYQTLGALVAAYASARPADAASSPALVPAVAIVGVGCRLPGANSVEAFWSNVVHGVGAIGEVPRERWDPNLFWDPDPAVVDKTYTKIGGFLTGFRFDGRRFRIPPKVADQIDPVQQITLAAVADALEDAGLQVEAGGSGRAFDRARCAVILGNSLGGEVKDRYAVRLAWPEVAAKLGDALLASAPPDQRAARLAALEAAYKADLPEINEDSMPGELSNVIAGRIANAFDLGGANYTMDAACASSMAAVQASVKSLQDGEHDVVITGGADRSMNLPTYVKFCKIGALSPDHSAPFDASANGFVMGEGCAILVLKRLDDALRDGDRVYAVIRGIGASSDGKGKGITAPNLRGQLLALRRAYEDAGIAPDAVDLIEAHGTSTVVGDRVEVEALTEVIGRGHRSPEDPIRIGSVKSMIGHLKSAAGAASLLKASLALHHGVLPPSLGFRDARPDVPFDAVPLRVQTQAEHWPTRPDRPRRAGVSAFGFGGTNFHIVLEAATGAAPTREVQARRAPVQTAIAPASAPPPTAAQPELPEGIWATSGADVAAVIEGLEALRDGRPASWEPSATVRIAAAYTDHAERSEQLERSLAALRKGTNPDLLRARGIHLQEGAVDGRLALTFTGQGSQYADMGRDLAAHFPLVAETFAEADRVLAPALGAPLTSLMYLAPGEDPHTKEEILRRTEFSQPATLALDVAIARLLHAYGVRPDMVAGHSLGEYAAVVASGILTYEEALHAVSARGREMAEIRLEDPGKMAGVATGAAVVDEVLAEIDGYVIAANKNCPSQTVIAGASDAVDEACERFRARGITVHPLPVSHAVHSRIVAPATGPLQDVLRELRPRAPQIPITTNVTAEWYPTGPDAEEKIVALLGQQISAPVEWTAQIERMYDAGARIFLECGPKRALTGFAVAILKRRPHLALYTNHPKRGGVTAFRDALAGLLVAGFPVRAHPDASAAAPAARAATSDAIAAWRATSPAEEPALEARPDLAEGVLAIVATATGYAPDELDLDYELEADLGIDTVKQAEVFSNVREQYGISSDAGFSMAEHRTLRALIDWAAERVGATRPVTVAPPPPAQPAPPIVAPTAPPTPLGDEALRAFAQAVAHVDGLDPARFAEAMLPALRGLVQAAFDAARTHQAAAPLPVVSRAPAPLPPEVRVVATGASVGLPGGTEVFAADNFARLLRGENRISPLGERARAFLDLSLVRLVKDARTGEGTFLPVDDLTQVIRLAGVKAAFDPEDYGLPESLVRALDVTSTLAIAAGLEALRDAGIPLVRAWQTTAGGKRVPRGWMLPDALADGTGVIFASAFPGYTQLIDKLGTRGDDGEGHFDRRFLFQILSLGHAQFAQLIGARGPNTQVNAACASSTQAIAIAEDWLRLGRADRVIVIGADDVTNASMLPWIGGGFMAAGAATTEDAVARAALPFDRRRHGMILGMGAVGIVLEREDDAHARGVAPMAALVATGIANSAFHGSRLHPTHITEQMQRVVQRATEREGITPAQLAASALFMSHETYTPARGGSAAAEIDALRAAFGEHANRITIANTKGFTGHAMGAGIEDAVALKALQYGRIPPVANFREPDESLGDLRISRGEDREVDYAIRLAAGFGSQVAIAVWRAVARGDDRIDPTRRAAWLRAITGYSHVVETIGNRTLRAEEGLTDRMLPLPSASAARSPAPAAQTPNSVTLEPAPPRDTSPSAVRDLVALIADKTGYAPQELDPEFELEADLGIDTVKQAEIFSALRERYGLERDDGFRLADYPTIAALAGWLDGQRATSTPLEITELTLVPADSPSKDTLVPAPRAARPPAAPTRAASTVASPVAPTVRPTASAPLPASFRVRRPVAVDVPTWGDVPIAGLRALVIGEGALATRITAALTAADVRLDAPPDLVIDLAGDARESFAAARALHASPPRRWVTLTRTGGFDAQPAMTDAFADGARAGFTKALGREWSETAATVLDVAPEQSEDEVAAAVLRELRAAPLDEVFVRNAQRRGVAYRVEPLPAFGRPRAEVVLITGGARGIGGAVARELARRGQRKLALVGRSEAPPAAHDLGAAKAEIRARIEAGPERATPSRIERELSVVRTGNEIRATLDAVSALGADVRYYAVDLSDPTAVHGLLARVRSELGRPDVVIHGAGIEESRKIADKDEAAFARVFDAKARGGRALLEALPRDAFFVSMGSVAGRFGNPGQVDYAAANDALARLCLARRHALHVDWTAWDDVGMAVRGGMRTLLSQRGVDLLPAEAGAGLLIDLIAAETSGELVVAGALGDFHPTVLHPLLDRLTFDGDGVIAERALSLETDPWLADHAIEGTAVLPGVIGLELMTAAAAAASPGLPPVGARHVRFHKPVKLHRDEPVTALLTAQPIDAHEVRCALVTERVLRTGRTQRTEHFEAIVVLGEVMTDDSLPSGFFPDDPMSFEAIYARFFHGPRFRVLDQVVGVATDGLVALAHADSERIAHGLHAAPLALEAAFQAAGLHRMVTHAQLALPAGLDEVRVLAAPGPDDELTLMVHHDGVSYDVDVDGPRGPVLRLRGFTLVDLGPVPPEHALPEPEGGRPSSFPDRGATSPGAPPRAERRGPMYDDATARAIAGFDDPADWLDADELAMLTARGTKRRVEDRIAGRIAAKRALSRLTGARAQAIRIGTASSGEPEVSVDGEPGPRVSISHAAGRAIAVAVSSGRVGIDLERIEARSDAFTTDWFTPAERKLAGTDAERQTILWSIKEAVLKALGVGMAISPRAVEIHAIGAGGADVVLVDDAAKMWRSLGSPPLRVQWRREEDAFVVVTARLAG